MADDYKKMLEGFCTIIEQRPYNLGSGARSLRSWIGRVAPQSPAADVKVCEIGRRTHMQLPDLYKRPETRPALGLEPEVAAIIVGPGPSEKLSVYDKFVNDTAAEIVHGHACSWGDALNIARRCWGRIDDTLRPFMDGTLLPAADGAVIPFPDEADDGSGIVPLDLPDRS